MAGLIPGDSNVYLNKTSSDAKLIFSTKAEQERLKQLWLQQMISPVPTSFNNVASVFSTQNFATIKTKSEKDIQNCLLFPYTDVPAMNREGNALCKLYDPSDSRLKSQIPDDAIIFSQQENLDPREKMSLYPTKFGYPLFIDIDLERIFVNWENNKDLTQSQIRIGSLWQLKNHEDEYITFPPSYYKELSGQHKNYFEISTDVYSNVDLTNCSKHLVRLKYRGFPFTSNLIVSTIPSLTGYARLTVQFYGCSSENIKHLFTLFTSQIEVIPKPQ